MKLKKLGLIAGLGVSVLLSGPVMANSLNGKGSSYLGGGFGYSDYTFWEGPIVQPGQNRTVTVEDSGQAYSLFLGYSVKDNLSLEVFYQDFGDAQTVDSSTTTVGADTVVFHDKLLGSISGYGLAVKANLPFGDVLGFYGKAGYMAWDGEFKLTSTVYENGAIDSGPTSFPASSFDNADPYLAIGMEFEVVSNVTLYADLSYLHADYQDENFHTFGYMAGVRWQFRENSSWRSGSNKRAEGGSRGLTACQDEYKATMGGVACGKEE